MYLTRLEIRAFGHFSGFEADSLGPGLVVLEGPNEAGKSTLRAAVRWALFGTPRGRPEHFAPAGESREVRLGLGGEELADGRAMLVRADARRERRVAVRLGAGPELGQEGLESILRGIDQALHDAIFSFDLQSISDATQLQGERLHATLALGATAGSGPSPTDALRALDQRIDALWRPRATSALLKVRERSLKDATAELRAARREVERRGEVERRVAEEDEALVAARARLDEAREATRLLRQRERAAEAFETWRRCEIARAALPPRPAFEPGVGATVTAARDSRARAAARRQAATDAAEKAEADLRALGELPGVLAAEDEIAEGLVRLERDRAAILAVPELERALAEAMEAETRAWAELGTARSERLEAAVITAELRAEALHHRNDTARLFEEAPRAAEAAERAHAQATMDLQRLEAEATAALPRLGDEALLRLDRWISGIDARRRDEARLDALAGELVRATPDAPDGWPPIDRVCLGPLRDAATRWAEAESNHAAGVAAAEASLASRQRAEAEAREAHARAEAAAAALAESRCDAPTLRALLPDVRGLEALLGDREAAAEKAAALQREDAALRRHLGLPGPPSPTALDAVDTRAPVVQGVKEAAQRLEDAQRAARALQVENATASTQAAAVVDAATLTDRRDAALRARAALDRAPVSRPGMPAAMRWAPPMVLVFLAVLALVTAAVLVAALSLAAAALLGVVAWRGGAHAGQAPHGDDGPAPELLARAGLPRDANRGDLEVALADLDRALSAVSVAEASRREAIARRERAEAAGSALADAEAGWRAALAEAGLPLTLTPSLAEAWLDAARRRERNEAELTDIHRTLARLEAGISSIDARVRASLGGAEMSREGAADAAARTERALREAEAAEAAYRQAVAELQAAEKATREAEAALAARRAVPKVPAEVSAAFAMAAGAAGLSLTAPTADLLSLAELAADATEAAGRRASLLEEQSSLVQRLRADLDVANALLQEAGEAPAEHDLELSLQRLKDAETERRASRRGLAPRLEAARDAAARAHAGVAAASARLEARARAEEAFDAFRIRVAAPDDLSPRASETWLRGVETAQARAAATRSLRERLSGAITASDALLEKARGLALRTVRPPPGDAAGAIATLQHLATELDAARHARTQRAERTLALNSARAQEALARRAEAEAEAALARALAAAGCEDAATFDAQAGALAEHEALDATLAPAVAELKALLGPSWHTLAPPEGGDPGQLGSALEAADDAEREADAECRALTTSLAEARVALRELSASADIPTRALAVETARAARDETRRVFWRLVLARQLLAETFERFRRERQPDVIRRASGWLAAATAGAYVALEADGPANALRFSLRDAGGERHPADALSAGTAALVYLSLRLALAVEQGLRTASLPIWVDDVLAHLDPEREEAAARMLVAAARATPETQIFVLSCRPSTVAAFQRLEPTAQVLSLGRWGGRDGPAPRSVTSGAAVAGTTPLPARAPEAPDPISIPAGPPAPSLDEARRALEQAGRPLAKADFLATLGLDDAAWDALRPLLDAAPDVVATGRARGRRYTLTAPPD